MPRNKDVGTHLSDISYELSKMKKVHQIAGFAVTNVEIIEGAVKLRVQLAMYGVQSYPLEFTFEKDKIHQMTQAVIGRVTQVLIRGVV